AKTAGTLTAALPCTVSCRTQTCPSEQPPTTVYVLSPITVRAVQRLIQVYLGGAIGDIEECAGRRPNKVLYRDVGFLDVLQPIQIFGLKRNKRTIGGTGNSPLTIDLLNLANRETVVNIQIKAGVYTQHHAILGIDIDVTSTTAEEGTIR